MDPNTETDVNKKPNTIPNKGPVQSAPPTSVADYQASKASWAGARADAAGTDAVIGSLIAVIFVVMVGYAGFQHHRQKQLEHRKKRHRGGPLRGRRGGPRLRL